MPTFQPGPHNLGLRIEGFRALLWDAYLHDGWWRIRSNAWSDGTGDARESFYFRMRKVAGEIGLRFERRMPTSGMFLDIKVTAAAGCFPSRHPKSAAAVMSGHLRTAAPLAR